MRFDNDEERGLNFKLFKDIFKPKPKLKPEGFSFDKLKLMMERDDVAFPIFKTWFKNGEDVYTLLKIDDYPQFRKIYDSYMSYRSTMTGGV
ncbi:hypothetical protein BBO99_00006244 [Phytophthora kernoviae]|uniref:RxLR effector protein n=2 Tax=Phytophthora kernoviae TaxID=325452 RepID=A0A3R7J8W1_9STRA|nr:hypothetical protein G195_007460 [Phytophthora kernoviae 00238/432]KAG2521988.1 hypothetical protein JM16_006045 [Phytophthora kernoviae]KAG2523596.1 hypothetical protein JM18_005713 [Phytophthora kernoviae]RLN38357.1 hypothetical protein BBI17_006348 [Phytophthora kernoviae]RLN78055.1 hypothetical protein BBO99_00006244 [Phytophthora kernoviae]